MNARKSVLFVVVMMVLSIVCSASAEMLGHWTFDDVVGASVNILDDSTAYDNDAVMNGGIDSGANKGFDAMVPGKFNNGLVFDGSDDSLTVPWNTAQYHRTYTEFTAMAWIKPNAGTAYRHLMGKMANTSGQYGWNIFLRHSEGKIGFKYYDGPSGNSDSLIIDGITIAPNEWMHVAVTFEANTKIAIYINGVEEANEITGVLSLLNGVNDKSLCFGQCGDSSSAQHWDGEIDDVRIYDEALSQSEIQAAITSPYSSELAQVESGAITTAYAKWWGTDKTETDATGILQNAINSNASTIIVAADFSPWHTRPLELRDDLEIVIETGAELRAKSRAYHGGGECVLTGANDTNITISGPGSIIMNKSDYQGAGYSSAEWRHAISLLSCDTVTIDNDLTISQTGGDGIYVGDSSGPCMNIVIEDCTVDGAYRNAISVISVENLRVSNCLLKNTLGTSPMAGIDFEPNYEYQPLTNCLVENCTIQNNATRGVLVATWNGDSTTTPYDITVSDCNISGGDYGMTLVKSATIEGLIDFNNCLIENTDAAGIEFRYFYNGGLEAVFRECKITNASSGIGHTDESPIKFLVTAGVTRSIGGITFVDGINDNIVDDNSWTEPDLIAVSPDTETYYFCNLNGVIIYNGSSIDLNDEYSVPTLEGDFYGDCQVDIKDLTILAGNWLNPVDFYDLAVLADNWLICSIPDTDYCP